MAVVALENSSFLDFAAYRQTDVTSTDLAGIAQAFSFDASAAKDTDVRLAVGLVLDRANDPTDLINSDWGTRQKALAELNADGTLWSTYGTDANHFSTVVNDLESRGVKVIGDAEGTDGYVTSAESRTIWVELDATTFQTVFGTGATLYRVGPSDNADQLFWTGSLSVDSDWKVAGLAIDYSTVATPINMSGSSGVELQQGPQGVGNASPVAPDLFADDVGADFYNFPLTGLDVPTGTIGLIEPGIGSALPDTSADSFQSLLDTFRARAGISTAGAYYVVNEAKQLYGSEDGGERSLDVGVVAAATPNSEIGLYVGSGYSNLAWASTYTAYQQAFWDTTNNPAVVSSSYGDSQQSSPGSPFQTAALELFVDAALRNISVFSAVGDGGSGDEMGNGLTNLQYSYSSPLGFLVSGTSISTMDLALKDKTLADVVQSYEAGDLATIWRLVAGGLTQYDQSPETLATFIETVWNEYEYDAATKTLVDGYYANNSGTGGVDPTQPTPWYQTAFGLTPTTSDPLAETGRGAPDVAALAGGNMFFSTPKADMTGLTGEGGTSAATPLWASLWTQMNAVFQDQGLPNLGYSNDLAYLAAAVAPASFNDITYGNNISSFFPGGTVTTQNATGDTVEVTPTGFGWQADDGYDLTSGLGTPNGLLLARALTTIAHSQMYFHLTDVLITTSSETAEAGSASGLASDGAAPDWHSGASQSLLFQASMRTDADVWSVHYGSGSAQFDGSAGAAYAWTDALAQQSLQEDFSDALVTLFDGQAQGHLFQANVAVGDAVSIDIAAQATDAYQASLTSPYGFMAFRSQDGESTVEVARAVAVATTAQAADDQDAVVRLRQNGTGDVAVQFYRVDDLAGTIDGIAPGEAGYGEAAAARAYVTTQGGTWISGAGYGAYSDTEITGVDAGDMIAMMLGTTTHTYSAFAQANEQVDGQNVAHLWSYGLNTWGWEDLYGGGDRDYNDLIVQLDFTSASGSGWLI